MAADGADSVHVWKSKVLNVQLKKKSFIVARLELPHIYGCIKCTVEAMILLSSDSFLMVVNREKKKKKQTQTYF